MLTHTCPYILTYTHAHTHTHTFHPSAGVHSNRVLATSSISTISSFTLMSGTCSKLGRSQCMTDCTGHTTHQLNFNHQLLHVDVWTYSKLGRRQARLTALDTQLISLISTIRSFTLMSGTCRKLSQNHARPTALDTDLPVNCATVI